jgi:hypothetical protein
MNTNTLFNTLLDAYTNDAINVAIANIQSQLGINTGDIASHYFDDETMLTLQSIFKDYIQIELKFNNKKA